MKYIDENIEKEIYNYPDHITDKDDGIFTAFTDNDATPFFVLQNGEIKVGRKCSTHIGEIKTWFKTFEEQQKFIEQIAVQGRYWSDRNLFSVWVKNDKNVDLIRKAIWVIGDLKRPCYLYYQDEKFQIKPSSQKLFGIDIVPIKSFNNEVGLNPKVEEQFDNLMKPGGYIHEMAMEMGLSVKSNGKKYVRPLNAFEFLAYQAEEMFCEYLYSDTTRSLTEQFNIYLLKNYGIGLKELLDFFHDKMRKNITRGSDASNKDNENIEWENNEYEELMDKCELYSNEYRPVYYPFTNKLIAYDVVTSRASEAVNAIYTIDDSEKFYVKDIERRHLKGGIVIYSFRVVKK